MARKQTKKKLPDDISSRLDEAVRAFREGTGLDDVADQEALIDLFDRHAAHLTGHEDDLILALAKIHDPRILKCLYRLSQRESDKNRIKTLRRAIYALEQSGLSADGLDRPPKEPLIKPVPVLRPLCYLSGFEPFQGLRSGMMALPATRGRYDTAFFLCSQAEGLIQFGDGLLTENQVQKNRPEIGAVAETGLLEASARAVRYVLSEACLRSRQKGLPFDENDYEAYMTRAGSRIPLAERPAVYDHISTEGLLDRVDIRSVSPRLFGHPFFNGLRVGENIVPYLTRLDEAQTSVLVLSKAQENERRLGIIEQAVRDIFTPDKKWQLRRQLEEIAYLLVMADETGLAEETLAVALDLEKKENWSDHPFIHLFMLISIDFFVEHDHHPDSPPVDWETRSPSGLILPGSFKPEPTRPGIIAPGMNEEES